MNAMRVCMIGSAAIALGSGTVAGQTASTPQEAPLLAEAHWGELVARDAALRSAGVTPVREADGPERRLPGPRSIKINPDGSLKIAPLQQLGIDEAAPAGAVEPASTSFAAAGGADLRAASNGLSNISLQTTFEAIPDNNTVIPPDTMGAIGAQHVMTMLNNLVRIQKRDGTIVSTVTLASFWSPIVGGGVFDPRILYDELDNRFIAVALSGAFSGSSAALIAVSATSDPTGVWRFFSIDTDAANIDFADFPDVGYNNRWYAITVNMFGIASAAFSGSKMWVLEKASALAPAGPLNLHAFPTSFDLDPISGVSSFSMRPAHTHDAAENTMHIVDYSGFFRSANGQPLMRISRVTGPTNAPVWSVLAGSPFGAALGLFDYPVKFNPNTITGSQAGTAARVDAGNTRMLDAEFRNGAIWTANGGGIPAFTALGGATVPDRTACVWTQINPAPANPALPFIQGGLVVGGVDEHYFYPSLAVNRADDMVIGFSHSSPNIFIQAGYTGRLGSDPLGTTRVPIIYRLGDGPYDKPIGAGGADRWGDYSQTSVDPKDDRTFWVIQEFAKAPVGPTSFWSTQWAKVGFVSCPSDFDGDGLIGPADLLVLLGSFGLFYGPTDLLDLLAGFGATCPTHFPPP